MPVIGLKRPKEETAKTRETKLVNATIVHPSTILPKRETSREVMESVKRARALPCHGLVKNVWLY